MKQFRIYLWIALWAIGASFAQAQNNPDSSTVHGLRELGSRSMTTGVQSTNHSGIPVSNVAELNTAADDLISVIEAAGVTDFKVYDYASYPFLTFLGKEADCDAMMKAMEEKIAAITPAVPYYLLIGKIIDENGKVVFKVILKMPVKASKSGSRDSSYQERSVVKDFTLEDISTIEVYLTSLMTSNQTGRTIANTSETTIEGLKESLVFFSDGPIIIGEWFEEKNWIQAPIDKLIGEKSQEVKSSDGGKIYLRIKSAGCNAGDAVSFRIKDKLTKELLHYGEIKIDASGYNHLEFWPPSLECAKNTKDRSFCEYVYEFTHLPSSKTFTGFQKMSLCFVSYVKHVFQHNNLPMGEIFQKMWLVPNDSWDDSKELDKKKLELKMNIITMSWALQAKDVEVKIKQKILEYQNNNFFEKEIEKKQGKVTQNAKYFLIKQIKKMVKNNLLALPQKDGDEVNFNPYADVTLVVDNTEKERYTKCPRFDIYYLNQFSHREDNSNKYYFYKNGPDDLYAALGTMNFRVCMKGKIKKTLTGYDITLEEGAIYIKDTFDFEGNQPLGNFDFCNVQLTDANSRIEMTNQVYRTFRNAYKIGVDYVVFSDLHTFPMNYIIFASQEEYNLVELQ